MSEDLEVCEYFAVDSVGRIVFTGACQRSLIQANCGEYTGYEGKAKDPRLWYAPEGELTERPSMNLGVSQNPFRVDNIPEGTVVTFPGGTVTVDDGFLEWSAIEPGEYEFHFANFPYQEETVIAHITNV